MLLLSHCQLVYGQVIATFMTSSLGTLGTHLDGFHQTLMVGGLEHVLFFHIVVVISHI